MKPTSLRQRITGPYALNRCAGAPQQSASPMVPRSPVQTDLSRNDIGHDSRASQHVIARMLLGAQEEERGRIGRELHDGVGQEIALLIAKLRFAAQACGLPEQTASEMWRLSGEAQKIGDAIRGISHDLYPAKLEYLGLSVAAESFCREFSNTHKISVTCTTDNIPRTLDRTVALSLYRVMQEALHNVFKHSGARHARVRLHSKDGELFLSVSDGGKGFDVDDNDRQLGLGILSMSERVYALRGTILVSSKPGEGTRIDVRVPCRTDN